MAVSFCICKKCKSPIISHLKILAKKSLVLYTHKGDMKDLWRDEYVLQEYFGINRKHPTA